MSFGSYTQTLITEIFVKVIGFSVVTTRGLDTEQGGGGGDTWGCSLTGAKNTE